MTNKTNFKLLLLLLLFFVTGQIFGFVDPSSPQGKLSPDTTGLNINEGDQIIWKEGHSPYLSIILQDALQAPQASFDDWHLIGHRIIFAVEGISKENFLSHQSLVKDSYAAKILRIFTVKNPPEFQFEYGDATFSAFVGEQTPFTKSSDEVTKSATWEIINSEQVVIKSLTTRVRYQVISYYTKANLNVQGSLKLNLDQSAINNGTLKFVRLGPGKSVLEKTAQLTSNGTFSTENLAKGYYKILYSEDGENFDRSVSTFTNINEIDNQLNLNLKFQTKYAFELSYQKSSEETNIAANLKWDQASIALAYGIFPQDTANELSTLPHFLGDFNSNTRLDRDGNPLMIPYADDNVDELIFLSWNEAATNQTLTGNYQNNTCTLKDSRDNRLYFTSTLKQTEYGPWVLPAKKLYVNWSLSYECGPNHGSTIQTMPLNGVPVGGVNDLGEIQAELPLETLVKIRNHQSFVQQWKFKDILDQSIVTVVLKATPL